MVNLRLRKKLYCSAAVLLFLFAVCGSNLQAADDNGSTGADQQAKIVFNKGSLPAKAAVTGLPLTQNVAEGSTIALADIKVNVKNYTITGWSTLPIPLINTKLQDSIVTALSTTIPGQTLYNTSDSLQISEDLTLYAVWALDINNNGTADYLDSFSIQVSGAKPRAEMLSQDDEVSLRSSNSGVSPRSGYMPKWDLQYDLTASYNHVYHTGCMYNTADLDGDGHLDEFLITLHPLTTFNSATQYVGSGNSIYLIIEYGGVLKGSGMIGGERQELMDTIKMEPGTNVIDVINAYPFRFDEVEVEGDASIKMYFVRDDGTFDNHPAASEWSITSWGAGTPHVFGNATTAYSDTLTVNFEVYNKPEFESEIISQYIDANGHIRLKQVSGTPAKYMMRSIHGLPWQPADAPLTAREKTVVNDSVYICLREADLKVGDYSSTIHNYYLNPNAFNQYDFHAKMTFWVFEQQKHLEDYADVYWNDFVNREAGSTWSDPFYTIIWNTMILPSYIPIGDPAQDKTLRLLLVGLMQNLMDMLVPGSNLDPEYYDANVATAHADALADAAMPAIGRAMADEMISKAPASCREATCLRFMTNNIPDLNRYVIIHTIPGVTSYPTAEEKHFVFSRNDFEFTLNFPGDNPLKVTAIGFYSERSEELKGTDLGGGKFSYVIRQVLEPHDVFISADPASDITNNEITMGGRVWSYANTLYINSDKAGHANIYTMTGTLLKQLNVSTGITSTQLERGIYVVEINGSRYKVIIK